MSGIWLYQTGQFVNRVSQSHDSAFAKVFVARNTVEKQEQADEGYNGAQLRQEHRDCDRTDDHEQQHLEYKAEGDHDGTDKCTPQPEYQIPYR